MQENGKHIRVGKDFFANYNCTLLDVAPKRPTAVIGERSIPCTMVEQLQFTALP
ncbi:hypothetical protein [uncultured Acetatifactor sp.]|uniref:hypothetical protein n=1 Tax=uncultured Acetatifactor sp. TaxID=1671927 RepID=UPI002633C672|nr:hypothetical protein [uncultured Acetatifactor sp.]